MVKPIDVQPGEQFGRWVVLREGERHVTPKGQSLRMIWCHCECGETKLVKLHSLMSGASTSCGCQTREANFSHGLHGHPLYLTWYGMNDRCHNERGSGFANYGARGIKVHPEWRGLPDGLLNCINWIEANIGPRPAGRHPSGMPLYTIDRINNDGNYEPGNLRWATSPEQLANRRCSR